MVHVRLGKAMEQRIQAVKLEYKQPCRDFLTEAFFTRSEIEDHQLAAGPNIPTDIAIIANYTNTVEVFGGLKYAKPALFKMYCYLKVQQLHHQQPHQQQ